MGRRASRTTHRAHLAHHHHHADFMGIIMHVLHVTCHANATAPSCTRGSYKPLSRSLPDFDHQSQITDTRQVGSQRLSTQSSVLNECPQYLVLLNARTHSS